MRKKVIAANWKMHGTQQRVKVLANGIATIKTAAEIIIFPPCIFIPMVKTMLEHTLVQVGSQNTAIAVEGAFTGEVSAIMLSEFGCRYVLIGHSERRRLFHETNDLVAKKFMAAQRAKLIPLLCVGETRDEHEAGDTLVTVLRQISAVTDIAGIASLQHCMIAYEPVWAIGTGLTASPEQAQAVHAKIREHIAKIDAKIADSIKILYGGSINVDNAASLLVMPDIDGGLVGAASLELAAFSKICKAA